MLHFRFPQATVIALIAVACMSMLGCTLAQNFDGQMFVEQAKASMPPEAFVASESEGKKGFVANRVADQASEEGVIASMNYIADITQLLQRVAVTAGNNAEGKLIVDVGSGDGWFSSLVLNETNAKVVAFDARSDAVEMTKSAADAEQAARLVVKQQLISNVAKDTKFHLLQGAESFSSPRNWSFIFDTTSTKQSLPAVTLDGAMKNNCPILVQTNTCGFDHRVIKGMTRMLRKCRPLVIFHTLFEDDTDGGRLKKTYYDFSSQAYEVYGIDQILSGQPALEKEGFFHTALSSRYSFVAAPRDYNLDPLPPPKPTNQGEKKAQASVKKNETSAEGEAKSDL